MYSYNPYFQSYLAHYGVKGMKWGVRRYRNEDGSLTALGEKRLGYNEARLQAKKNSKDSQALGESLTPYLIAGVAGKLTLSGASSASDNRFVREYRKEHPNTKLSKNEILKLRDTAD